MSAQVFGLGSDRCVIGANDRLLAAGNGLVDNARMTDDTSAMKPAPRSLMRRIEYRLIALVMAAIAFLLERAVLRSIERGEAEP
ncbi:hypothetical protein [Candidatus Nitrospira inopinata]|uniref:Uncharacterized protein n=1 Tax=Candidatus Nitrospira inopinata TaxID=1715989 RepID=A0A0S4KV22_9BACT|nr:hypothetical protein [Candidatus Nitrospira inopinata]CUQ66187.1 protein of unknown function [Candidatus Nitrospira inopinata]